MNGVPVLRLTTMYELTTLPPYLCNTQHNQKEKKIMTSVESIKAVVFMLLAVGLTVTAAKNTIAQDTT